MPLRNTVHYPTAQSDEEILLFKSMQQHFRVQYESIFHDKLAPRTVVIIPSLTLDTEILSKVSGSVHYEERLLCLLMLLRMPRTHLIYVTSVPIDPIIIDYYLHLLPGITGYHARQRLTLLSCFDASPKSLTEKILDRPRLMDRIRHHIIPGEFAHLACFNVTHFERTLAVRLGIPLYGCDPDLLPHGTKSGSRKIFKECNLTIPAGYEDLYNEKDIVFALAELKKENPLLKRAVVKMNDGFSGEGNAVFSFENYSDVSSIKNRIRSELPYQLKIVADNLTYETFMEKFESMGGIVEEYIEGETKTSPSVQCRINPIGNCDVLSTHDQLLGGDSGQVFLGAHFPANNEYAVDIGLMGKQVAEKMKTYGVLGRFGVDFISVKTEHSWKHYAIEINLRKGGTTHPYLMLQFLTDGEYHPDQGLYYAANSQPRYYFASDNVRNECYKGLTPHDLIDIAMMNGLQYDGSSQEGVMFHLIGALSQYGKVGVVCIGSTPERAIHFFNSTVNALDNECA